MRSIRRAASFCILIIALGIGYTVLGGNYAMYYVNKYMKGLCDALIDVANQIDPDEEEV